MTQLVFESPMPCTLEQLWKFHSSSEALHSLNPPLTKVRLKGELNVVEGARLEVTSTILGFIHQDWEVKLSAVNPPKGFTDQAIRSPFQEWKHHHVFLQNGDMSKLRDEIHFVAKGGALGRIISIVVVTILFKFRHMRTRSLVKR